MYSYKALVTNVVDGDTVDLSIDLGFNIWHNIRVRLIGIDTPEKWHPYGKVVTKFLKQHIEGKKVKINVTKKDKYGRYLVSIFTLENMTMSVNNLLTSLGMAKSYHGGSRDNTWTEEELSRTTHPMLKTSE